MGVDGPSASGSMLKSVDGDGAACPTAEMSSVDDPVENGGSVPIAMDAGHFNHRKISVYDGNADVARASVPSDADSGHFDRSSTNRKISIYDGAKSAEVSTYAPGDPAEFGLIADSMSELKSVLRAAYRCKGLPKETSSTDDENWENIVADDASVYLTAYHRLWERHYLKRLASKMHRLVCAELDRSEEALLMLYLAHSPSLEGQVHGCEATKLVDSISRAFSGGKTEGAKGFFTSRENSTGETSADGTQLDEGIAKISAPDGSVSFLSMLRWYRNLGNQRPNLECSVQAVLPPSSPTGFDVASLFVGVLGSGLLQNDTRLDALDWAALRKNVVRYRRLLLDVKRFQEEMLFAPARELERCDGLEKAMSAYYAVLAREFEGEGEYLFELFCLVDKEEELFLGRTEVKALLRLLDGGASACEIDRYVQEINLDDGPLSFPSLVDWWDQACAVKNSLVSEKGARLRANIKANSAGAQLSGFFVQTAVQRQWSNAITKDRLEVLQTAYLRTVQELREYKMERDLRKAEEQCSML